MPALNAIRLNPEFKAKYEAMVKVGKPAKVAIVAIMRKLSSSPTPSSVISENGPPLSLTSTDTTGVASEGPVRAIAVIPYRARNTLHRPSETTAVRLATVHPDPKRTLRSGALREAGKRLERSASRLTHSRRRRDSFCIRLA